MCIESTRSRRELGFRAKSCLQTVRAASCAACRLFTVSAVGVVQWYVLCAPGELRGPPGAPRSTLAVDTEMARSPRRISAHRRSRSRSRELSRLRTQLNGKGKPDSVCIRRYLIVSQNTIIDYYHNKTSRFSASKHYQVQMKCSER